MDAKEVAKHNSRESCYVIISGSVYDVTDVIEDHPGGSQAVLRWAGRDATRAYVPIHPSNTLEKHLPKDKHLGPVDPSTVELEKAEPEQTKPSSQHGVETDITVVQNLDDIEAVARQKVSAKAWAYFNSAADSLNSFHTNRADWSKISFRPRILRNVARANMKRRARLGHPDGELCLARGAAQSNIVYCSSTYSSVAHEDLAPCFGKSNGGALTFQLYVPRKKDDCERLIKVARDLKCKALVVTVDTAVLGRREEDDRYQAQLEVDEGRPMERTIATNEEAEGGVFRGVHCSTLDWDDIRWIKRLWGAENGPVYIKGVQTAEDALLAMREGIQGIYLSNHGGRQLDFAPSSIRTLLEIRKFCPEVLENMEVYLDGGVRRGTDVVKALCLGATAVGLGRPFLYALSAYGTDGVLRAIELLSAEIQTTMRLMGVTDINDLDLRHVNTKILERELPDELYSHPQRPYKL
ncbi:Cytochrome b2, mitochondrial [Cyphellophora attinorum]|uniref:Cytochrome b2, mitochondrial n=1 Tax=Cyphellophora attinorum TaxID=1664694 RepID=A0A0N1NZ28_9EURO|nr:Cytochrome b2, mitochondrial [Phialophora attinorum]KPI41236.1 Cytochrome b2, mitochondrial [Phialophora attinorum]